MTRHIQRRPFVERAKTPQQTSSEKIAEQVQAFLQSGGVIKELPFAGDEESKIKAFTEMEEGIQ